MASKGMALFAADRNQEVYNFNRAVERANKKRAKAEREIQESGMNTGIGAALVTAIALPFLAPTIGVGTVLSASSAAHQLGSAYGQKWADDATKYDEWSIANEIDIGAFKFDRDEIIKMEEEFQALNDADELAGNKAIEAAWVNALASLASSYVASGVDTTVKGLFQGADNAGWYPGKTLSNYLLQESSL